jgi:4-hydroxy-L-threonine phosphate dehydrogenase PdxA
MGDAGGVGPELILKVLAQARADARPVVVGDAAVMQRAAALVPDAPPLQTIDVAGVESATAIPLLEPPGLDIADVPSGRFDVRSGVAAGACLTYAFELPRS